TDDVRSAHRAGLRHGHRLDLDHFGRRASGARRGLRHRTDAAHDRQSRRPDRLSRARRTARFRDRSCRHPRGPGYRACSIGCSGRCEGAIVLTRTTAMNTPIHIRMGGYGPASTGFSRALKRIGERLSHQFGDDVDIKYVWNIMDLGYRADDILWLVEHGLLT